MNVNSPHPGDPIANLMVASIIEVDGTHIIAELDSKILELSRIHGGTIYPIGQFGSIIRMHYGRKIIYGYVSRLRMRADYEVERGIVTAGNSSARVIEADLFGEGEWIQSYSDSNPTWALKFERGVSTYPLPQQMVYLTPKTEYRYIFGNVGSSSIKIGEHVGSGGIPAYADLNELLGKHTAVLGSTGSGKSGTVAVIIHAILDRGSRIETWNPRIILLDPHNEYGPSFLNHARLSADEGSLSLPYWSLNLQETCDLLIGKSVHVATSQMNIVKDALLEARTEGSRVIGLDPSDITVDSPVPYSVELLRTIIEGKKPKQPSGHGPYDSLLNKLDTLVNDNRMSFMMNEWDGVTDPLAKIAGQFFGEGDPIRIIDLSGMPNEVAGAVSSAIARILFSVKVWQTSEERKKSPILLVCEEAHRYVPNVGEAQYEAAQAAIRRIAKEGRKYGIGLMLVSQRPSEIEATVLSQCNSWIVLRMTNDLDRERVRSILPDSLTGLTKMLSGLRRREALFVGLAAQLPSRILMSSLDPEKLPESQDIDFESGWRSEPLDDDTINTIGDRWRRQIRP